MNEGVEKVSSGQLAKRMHSTASQIRQDLNCFGGFGQQGYGYNVAELRAEIGAILHLNGERGVILIGAGNLGRAIAAHIDFTQYGCRLIGIFDKDPELAGFEIAGLKICGTGSLAEFCRENKPDMAVLCIPRDGAEQTVKLLIENGVNAFWNYSHYDISGSYPNAAVENVHLSDSLMTLSYSMSNKALNT